MFINYVDYFQIIMNKLVYLYYQINFERSINLDDINLYYLYIWEYLFLNLNL
jgi:hypothetical protein